MRRWGGAYLGAGQLDQAGSFLEQALAAGAAVRTPTACWPWCTRKANAVTTPEATTSGHCNKSHQLGSRGGQEPVRNPHADPHGHTHRTATYAGPRAAGGTDCLPCLERSRGKYDDPANAAGSGRRLVVQEMHQPAFSPGGQWLAVNGDRPNHMNLFVVRADGSELFEVDGVRRGRQAGLVARRQPPGVQLDPPRRSESRACTSSTRFSSAARWCQPA